MTRDDIRRLALDGIELPARARVDDSRATPGAGYTADVTVLDGAGNPTDPPQRLAAVPLDPLWHDVDGVGVFAPPAPGRIVAIVWMGGVAGHPVVTAGAWINPAAAPRLVVPAGEYSIQGPVFDARMLADEYRVSDEAGTVVSLRDERVKVASPADDLLAALVELGEAIRDGSTENDTDTASGSSGRALPLNAGTKSAINAALDRFRAVLRT